MGLFTGNPQPASLVPALAVKQQKKNLKRNLQSILFHLLVGLSGLIMIYPILWLAGASFKPAQEIWTRVLDLTPTKPTIQNYINGWRGFGGISFSVFYGNTFLVTILGTAGAVFSSSFIAYGFARMRFPGRKIWFGCMILTLMLPVQIQLIPQYILFSKLGWINTFLPLIVPQFCGQAFFIFMLGQFIRGIPRSLDEAAEIDGCSPFGVFFRLIIPLISPAMITTAIFSFYWSWSDFLMPLIYLSNPRLYTVALALRSFADPSGMTDWGAIFAMSFLSLLPVFIIFIFLQKYIIEGISTSGLKG